MQMEKTPYTTLLLEKNGNDPDEFTGWIFHPGMLFNSPLKWWGDGGQRDSPMRESICAYIGMHLGA